MEIKIREFKSEDTNEMINIWNEIVIQADAFPQKETLTIEDGKIFFKSQSFTAVAEYNGQIVGLYILHPNNIGRCAHIANASYAVDKNIRGQHIGKKLVIHSLNKARELNFKILQFNAVVKSNKNAIHLYENLGFKKLGVIPKGYLKKDNTYEDIISYIYEL
ncbi:GNAT family N-acetyltransferase [Anaerofustis sp.]|uniref:GNAT family N-acetyltransferase n=1 Tax=Anaerofustis sp. TaxID=1872517 RepID=UPI0025BEF65A|nr:GNAT family N-acetyltransferase [Anaerofustis sp.]